MRTLTTSEFEERIDPSQLGRPTKYPWRDWLRDDLSPVEVIEGEDFTCKPGSLRQQVNLKAKERGLRASLVKLKGEGSWAIVPSRPDEDEADQGSA